MKAMTAELGEYFAVVEWQPSQEQFNDRLFPRCDQQGCLDGEPGCATDTMG